MVQAKGGDKAEIPEWEQESKLGVKRYKIAKLKKRTMIEGTSSLYILQMSMS